MAEPFLGEIRALGFNFAPRGWAECNGQLLPISSNTALFSLLGTTYGGDGRTTFALPDLRGRVAVQQGTGPGLKGWRLGERGGSETNTLLTQNMPAHNHTIGLGSAKGDQKAGVGRYLAKVTGDDEAGGGFGDLIFTDTAPAAGDTLSNGSVRNTGSNIPVNNIQPTLALNYCIALVGLYPSRS